MRCQSSLFTQLSVQLHELGHNLGLGHTGEDGASYGDGSCYMGYGGGDVKMCYNGESLSFSVLCLKMPLILSNKYRAETPLCISRKKLVSPNCSYYCWMVADLIWQSFLWNITILRYLGWYSEFHQEFNPTEETSKLFRLIGLSDYNEALVSSDPSTYTIVLRIETFENEISVRIPLCFWRFY